MSEQPQVIDLMQALKASLARDSYDAIPAMNFSSLKHISVSPMMFQWRKEHPEPRKPSFIFGGAVHCRLLEPEKFDKRYAVFDGTRKGEDWRVWQDENPGKESLKPPEMERVKLIVDRVMKGASPSHRSARDLLRGGRREEAVTWTDEETGLACKGRLDYLRPDLLVDVKTIAKSPSPFLFGAAAASYGYHGQGAFYHDGATADRRINGKQAPWIVALQSKEPYDCACYMLDERALNAGRQLYRRLLRVYLQCTQSGMWPGVAPDPMPLLLPAWADGASPMTIEEEEF